MIELNRALEGDQMLAPARELIEIEDEKFASLTECWVCGGNDLADIHQGRFDFKEYAEQDSELADYTGHQFWLRRCRACGFAQPDVVPTLSNYFGRMYDQHWSEDWIKQEFEAEYKDRIFRDVLGGLSRRLSFSERKLLDIGAHVGRFIFLAHHDGWEAEGVELNPRTSAFAAKRTRLAVHRLNAHELLERGRKYSAITMLDVLEHIPEPLKILRSMWELLDEGGWIVIKVPCGPSQLLKEKLRARLRKGYRVSVADNLVHINHFSARSLRQALQRAQFSSIHIGVGAPELVTTDSSLRSTLSNAFRLGVYHAGRLLPGGTRTPLALNLQAYAQKSSAEVNESQASVI